MSIREPAPPELEAFLEAERAAPPMPPALRAAVLSRLHASIIDGPGPELGAPATAAPASLLGPKLVGALLVGAVTGAALHAALAPPVIHEVTKVVELPRPAPSVAQTATVAIEAKPPASSARPPTQLAAPPPANAPPAANAPRATSAPHEANAPHATGAPESDADLARQRELIERARTAYGRGDPAAALTSLQEVRRRYPGGRLEEEAAALSVPVLVALGKTEEAKQTAQAFVLRWPQSVLRKMVERAVRDP